MKKKKKSGLVKAFMTVAMGVGFVMMGPDFSPPEAQAQMGGGMSAANVATMAAVIIILDDNGREIRKSELLELMISSPTEKNIALAVKHNVISEKEARYAKTAVKKLNLPEDIKSEDVQGKHKEDFQRFLRQQRNMAIVSSKTDHEAVDRGLSENSLEFYKACQEETAIQTPVIENLKERSTELMECVEDKESNRDMKTAGIVIGTAVVLTGLVGFGMRRSLS